MTDESITQEYLHELFSYDPEIGLFFWKVARSNRLNIGDIAGWDSSPRDGKRYRVVNIDGNCHYAHRLVFLYMDGSFPEHLVDHLDGDGLNNKWNNLRRVTPAENNQNMRRRSDNKSGFTGVTWYKRDKTWAANITTGGKVMFLGRYKTLKEAIIVRRNAEKELGFHKNHGHSRPL